MDSASDGPGLLTLADRLRDTVPTIAAFLRAEDVLTLCHVCRVWRNELLECTPLWRRLLAETRGRLFDVVYRVADMTPQERVSYFSDVVEMRARIGEAWRKRHFSLTSFSLNGSLQALFRPSTVCMDNFFVIAKTERQRALSVGALPVLAYQAVQLRGNSIESTEVQFGKFSYGTCVRWCGSTVLLCPYGGSPWVWDLRTGSATRLCLVRDVVTGMMLEIDSSTTPRACRDPHGMVLVRARHVPSSDTGVRHDPNQLVWMLLHTTVSMQALMTGGCTGHMVDIAGALGPLGLREAYYGVTVLKDSLLVLTGTLPAHPLCPPADGMGHVVCLEAPSLRPRWHLRTTYSWDQTYLWDVNETEFAVSFQVPASFRTMFSVHSLQTGERRFERPMQTTVSQLAVSNGLWLLLLSDGAGLLALESRSGDVVWNWQRWWTDLMPCGLTPNNRPQMYATDSSLLLVDHTGGTGLTLHVLDFEAGADGMHVLSSSTRDEREAEQPCSCYNEARLQKVARVEEPAQAKAMLGG